VRNDGQGELLPHQREALSFFIANEENPEMRGSLCADETGTGKTVMALALVVNRIDKVPNTLVIVKASTLRSWEKALEKFTPGLQVQLKILLLFRS
jgi:SNF2 family DNA or RNA helicase